MKKTKNSKDEFAKGHQTDGSSKSSLPSADQVAKIMKKKESTSMTMKRWPKVPRAVKKEQPSQNP
jgi:hypothetical protein